MISHYIDCSSGALRTTCFANLPTNFKYVMRTKGILAWSEFWKHWKAGTQTVISSVSVTSGEIPYSPHPSLRPSSPSPVWLWGCIKFTSLSWIFSILQHAHIHKYIDIPVHTDKTRARGCALTWSILDSSGRARKGKARQGEQPSAMCARQIFEAENATKRIRIRDYIFYFTVVSHYSAFCSK